MMPESPENGVRYDDYELQRYHCIAVDDDIIETLLGSLLKITMFWHTTDVSGKGLAYCGVTLIPPDSMSEILAVLPEDAQLFQLRALLERACAMGKWVIHYGI